MKKVCGYISLFVLILTSVSCLTFSGNRDLVVVDNTKFEFEPKWPFGVERQIKDTKNYAQKDIYLAFTGGVNGKSEATDTSIGFSRLESAVARYRETSNFLLLDLGNLTGGNNMLLASDGKDGIELARRMGYNFIVPGPKDIAFGNNFVDNAQMLGRFGLPSVYSSFNLFAPNGRDPIFPRYQLYDFSGYKVAILGFVPPLCNRVRGRDDLKIDTSINQFIGLIKTLRETGVDGIVVASYLSLEDLDFYNGKNGFIDLISEQADLILLASENAKVGFTEVKNGCTITRLPVDFTAFGVATIRLENSRQKDIKVDYVTMKDITEPSLTFLPKNEEIEEMLSSQKDKFMRANTSAVAILPYEYKTTREDLENANTNKGLLVPFLFGLMLKTAKADVVMFTADYIVQDGYDQGVLDADEPTIFKDDTPLAAVELTGVELYNVFEENAKYTINGSPNRLNSNLREVYNFDEIKKSLDDPNYVSQAESDVNNEDLTGLTNINATTNFVNSLTLNGEAIKRDNSTLYRVVLPSSLLSSKIYGKWLLMRKAEQFLSMETLLRTALRSAYSPY